MREIAVFLNVRSVAKRDRSLRYVARWFARGSGTEMYASSQRETPEAAEALARKWIAGNAVCREKGGA